MAALTTNFDPPTWSRRVYAAWIGRGLAFRGLSWGDAAAACSSWPPKRTRSVQKRARSHVAPAQGRASIPPPSLPLLRTCVARSSRSHLLRMLKRKPLQGPVEAVRCPRSLLQPQWVPSLLLAPALGAADSVRTASKDPSAKSAGAAASVSTAPESPGAKSAGAAAFARTAVKSTRAKSAGAAASVRTASKDPSAKSAGAAAYARTAGKDPRSAKSAGAARQESTNDTGVSSTPKSRTKTTIPAMMMMMHVLHGLRRRRWRRRRRCLLLRLLQ